jgi:hypothetical protein
MDKLRFEALMLGKILLSLVAMGSGWERKLEKLEDDSLDTVLWPSSKQCGSGWNWLCAPEEVQRNRPEERLRELM